MHSIEFSPRSKEHIEKLFEFYERQELGKGSAWMASFIDEIDKLELNPQIGQYLITQSEGIRRMVTQDRFRTIVVYRVDGELIKVSGIYDSRSNWKLD